MKKYLFSYKILFLTAFMLSSACSVIPQFELQKATKASDAYEKLSQHLAKLELGAFGSPESFESALNDYASIIGGFESIKVALPSGDQNGDKTKDEAANTLAKLLDNCLRLVNLLAEEHKSAGLVPASGISQPVRVGCDSATKSILASVR